MAGADKNQDIADTVARKFLRNVMPLLGFLYLISYIDRQNIGFAKLQMASDLSLSETAFGLGAGLFFIGYFLFEVPSNLFLARIGARIWFARIMLSWGVATLALGFTHGAVMFYILRFVLGACEAGFFPGVIYLLTLWMPEGYRARMIGWFMIASAVANAVGGPICGAMLDLDGTLGLYGWQWVFVATSIPAMVGGVVTLFVLPNGPQTARFYTPAEKSWIRDTIAAEDARNRAVEHVHPLAALADGRVILIACTYIGFPLANYGLNYWLPTVVKGFGVSNTVNGLLAIIPGIVTAWALWWVPHHSARTGEKTWHIVIPAALGAVCLALSVVVPSNPVRFALLCVAAACVLAPQPVFWTLPSRFLRGASAAAGLAAVNSVGHLGGFVAQTAVPAIRDATGSTLAPMFFLAACLAVAAVMVLVVQMLLNRQPALSADPAPAALLPDV
jgi:MFS family permease